MNYSQTVIDKARQIGELSDAFEDVRITLEILTSLDTSAYNNRFSVSIQRIVYKSLEELDAIQYKIEHDYTLKE